MSRGEAERLADVDTVRVLHVDDDEAFLDLAAEYLTRESPEFEVLTAEDSTEGLSLLDAERVDCVVSDFDMPGADGLAFLEAVRELDEDLPFVLFTGKGSEEIASEAIAAGVTDYLQKETGTDQYAMLANRIEHAVERRRAREELTRERRRFELVGRASADAFWDLDLVAGTVERSDGFASMFGYDEAELDDDRDWWRERLHPDDRDRVEAALEETIEAGEDDYQVEYRLRNADGSYSRVTSHAFVVYRDGEPSRVIGAVTDVTDLVRRDRALADVRSRLELVLEGTDTGVWEWDTGADVIHWDGTAGLLVGLDAGAVSEPADAFLERVHEDDRDRLTDAVAATGPEDRHLELEFRVRTGDGSVAWLEVKGIFRPGSGDRPDRLLGLVSDVTGRKERERAMERYETIFEATGDGVYAVDEAGRYTYVNEAMARLRGYDREELVGEHVSLVIDEEDVARGEALIGELLRDDDRRAGTIEMEVITRDGERVPTENHIALLPTEDGEFRGTVGVVRDVSERKAREQELERYETIVEATGDAVYALDESGRYTFANTAHTALLGYEKEELLGEHVSLVAGEEDVERGEALIRELLSSDGRRLGTIEVELETRDGERIPAENHLAVLTDEDGRFRGTAGIVRDVSEREERAQVLEALHEATRHLIRADSPEDVAQLTAEAARDVLGYVENTVRLLEGDDRLVPKAITSAMRSRVGDRPVYRVGQEPVGRVFAEGEPAIVDDSSVIDDDIDRSAGAAMYVPIGDYGAMTVSDDEVGSLDESDVQLASLLAANAAAALERIEHVGRRRERERSLEALHNATRRLLGAETRGDAAQVIAETATDVLGYPVSSVRLRSEDGQEMVPAGSVGLDEDERSAYGIDEGPLGEVLVTGETRVYDDLSVFSSDYGVSTVESMLVMPLGEHGALAVGDTGSGRFDESERQLAAVLAANAETVMDRIAQARGLEKQNERLDEFASVVSHDLRNPLNVAAGQVKLLGEEFESDRFDSVERSLARMNEIIDDVLSLARGGVEVVEPDEVDLRQCVDVVWETTGSEQGTLVVDDDLGTIPADRTRLKQLLENLFGNAVEHAGPDVTVRVGPLPGGRRGFFVEDDGPGIPPDEREQVFESGYSTTSGGTGFGLAIASEIADAHGWQMAVADGSSGGARFEVNVVDPAVER